MNTSARHITLAAPFLSAPKEVAASLAELGYEVRIVSPKVDVLEALADVEDLGDFEDFEDMGDLEDLEDTFTALAAPMFLAA